MMIRCITSVAVSAIILFPSLLLMMPSGVTSLPPDFFRPGRAATQTDESMLREIETASDSYIGAPWSLTKAFCNYCSALGPQFETRCLKNGAGQLRRVCYERLVKQLHNINRAAEDNAAS